MRHSELLHQLRSIHINGGFAGHIDSNPSQGTYSLKALQVLRERLELAKEIPGLSDRAAIFAKSPGLLMAGDSCAIGSSEYNQLRGLAYALDISVLAMIQYLESNYSDSLEEPNLISVKLPIGSQFALVARSIQELDKIFSQCLSILEEPSALEVKSWERGSLWIDLAVGGPIAVGCLASLAWSAVCVLKKFRETQLTEQLVKAQGIKNDMLGTLRDEFQKGVKALIDAEAKRLDEKHSKKKGEPETILRLANCIKSLFEMMNQGAEVHPALMAPQTVKDSFPNMKDVLGLPPSTKLLSEHSESEAGSDTTE